MKKAKLSLRSGVSGILKESDFYVAEMLSALNMDYDEDCELELDLGSFDGIKMTGRTEFYDDQLLFRKGQTEAE